MWVTGWPVAAMTNSSGQVAESTVSGPHWPSAPVTRRWIGRADPLAGLGRHAWIDLDVRLAERTVGRRAGGKSGDLSVQRHLRLGRDIEPRGLAAGDELVDLAERARVERDLAMIELAEHQVGRAAQRRDPRW